MKAYNVFRLTAAIATIALAGCKNAFEGYSCTAQFVYGLEAYVQDSISGAKIASGATLEVRDGSFSESVTLPAGRQDLDGLPLLAAGERAGTYTATVTKSGYAPWTKSNIRVTADKCHVNTTSVAARLVKN